MRCPYCNEELEIGGVDGILRGCPKCRNLGTEILWQELIDLMKEYDLCYDALIERTKEVDRTRKALDVAVDGLLAVWRATDCTTKQGSIAYNVLRDLNIKPLDRIKALEQKGKQ